LTKTLSICNSFPIPVFAHNIRNTVCFKFL
jgi:hypothetical protein